MKEVLGLAPDQTFDNKYLDAVSCVSSDGAQCIYYSTDEYVGRANVLNVTQKFNIDVSVEQLETIVQEMRTTKQSLESIGFELSERYRPAETAGKYILAMKKFVVIENFRTELEALAKAISFQSQAQEVGQ